MNESKCRVCGNTNNHIPIFAREMFLGTKDEFEYIFCKSCSSLSIKTIPLNIVSYYKNYYSLNNNDDYFDTRIRNSLKNGLIKSAPKSIQRKILSKLLNTQNDFRLKAFSEIHLSANHAILDVGCGSGDFLKELHFLGFRNLTGIDEYIEEDISISNGINIYKKTIDKMKGKFKLIMFHHSLEHMSNLQEALCSVHNLLDDQGVCLIRIPHIDSFSFRKFQGNWFSIHAPFHYTLPSLNGMKRLCENSHLQIQKHMGEQLYYFFLLSANHALGITDYDSLGIRTHFESQKMFVSNPPLYTAEEIRFWKRKARTILGSGLEDWIAYFLVKNS